ncbi:type VII secretion target [Microbacterium sp.]|uniref:type VII secretion target n=1 Tax=Microbacterium sp. TaxID=51671 RepID=UPI0039E6C13F
MAVADRIVVDVDDLRAHASRVQRVASDVEAAADAARVVSVGGEAFGVLCAFLAPPASLASGLVGEAIGEVSALIARSAVELRAVGEDFEAVEARNVELIRQLEEMLG